MCTGSPNADRIVVVSSRTVPASLDDVTTTVPDVRTIRPVPSSQTESVNGAKVNRSVYGWLCESVSGTVPTELGTGTRYPVAGCPSTSRLPTSVTGPRAVSRVRVVTAPR